MILRPSIIQKPFSPLAGLLCGRGGDFSGSFFQSLDGSHPGSPYPIPSSFYEF